MKLKIGDKVRLKNKKKVARIKLLLADIHGGVILNKPLGKFTYWNKKDLEKVK